MAMNFTPIDFNYNKIFEKTQEMEEYLTDISLARRGEIRIGCNQTFAKNILPNLIKKFKTFFM